MIINLFSNDYHLFYKGVPIILRQISKFYFLLNISVRLSDITDVEPNATDGILNQIYNKKWRTFDMDVNGISQAVATYEAPKPEKNEEKKNRKDTRAEKPYDGDSAAVYKKEKEAPKKVKYDKATVEKLKAEANQRTEQLRSLVEKMLSKQGQKFTTLTDALSLIENGTVKVDPKVSEQAAADISDDGYWGIEQTSERLVSFAKALAGNDPAHADAMIDAMKKGFEEATKSWGKELPEICKKTLDTAMDKLNKWKEEARGNGQAGKNEQAKQPEGRSSR